MFGNSVDSHAETVFTKDMTNTAATIHPSNDPAAFELNGSWTRNFPVRTWSGTKIHEGSATWNEGRGQWVIQGSMRCGAQVSGAMNPDATVTCKRCGG